MNWKATVWIIAAMCLASLVHAQQRCMVSAEHTAISEDALLEREAKLREWISMHTITERNTITIPVVFHVIYNTPEENISDLQIHSQIDALNRDMGFRTRFAGRIPDDFKGLDVTIDFQFCLATRDPDGNPTSGTTRKQTEVVDFGLQTVSGGRRAVHYTQYGGQDAWDQDRYINIWVAGLGGFLGFATFPETANFPEEDGVILTPEAVGTLGTAVAPYEEGHTLTHELGHYFNLYHPWGPETGCFNDDFVDDTPLQQYGYEGCPAHPQVSCGSADMFMNFMDFTDDACMAMFTQGQRDRVYAALHVYRPLLMQNNPPCTIAENTRPKLTDIQVFFAPSSQTIVVADQRPAAFPIVLRLFTIDGKEVWSESWNFHYIRAIDAGILPPGMYIVTLETTAERHARKVLVY